MSGWQDAWAAVVGTPKKAAKAAGETLDAAIAANKAASTSLVDSLSAVATDAVDSIRDSMGRPRR